MAQDNKKGVGLLAMLLAVVASIYTYFSWSSQNRAILKEPSKKHSKENGEPLPWLTDIPAPIAAERSAEQIRLQENNDTAEKSKNLPVLNISLELSQLPYLSVNDEGKILISGVKAFKLSDYHAINLTISEIAVDDIVYRPVTVNLAKGIEKNKGGCSFTNYLEERIRALASQKTLVKDLKETINLANSGIDNPSAIADDCELPVTSLNKIIESLETELSFKREALKELQNRNVADEDGEGFDKEKEVAELLLKIEEIERTTGDRELIMGYYIRYLQERVDEISPELAKSVTNLHETLEAIIDTLLVLATFPPALADDLHPAENADFCYINLRNYEGIER